MSDYIKAKRHSELNPEELKWTCPSEAISLKTTKEIEPSEEIIGQEKALAAIRLGVDIHQIGYNIFVTGISGTGKFTTIQKVLEKLNPEKPKLSDYVYVNNFKDPDRPILLVFNAGEGVKFKQDLSSSIKFLQKQIPMVLESSRFTSKKKKIINEFGEKQNILMSKFEEKLKKNSFTLGQLQVGESARPEIFAVVNEKPVYIQQINELIEENVLTRTKAKNIVKKYNEYQEDLQIVFKESMKINKEFQDEISKLEKDEIKYIIKGAGEGLRENYPNKKVHDFLDQMEEDILDNLESFKSSPGEKEGEYAVFGSLDIYDANVILDNSKTNERPVVIETTPNYNNMFGVIEKYSDGEGNWFTDFRNIKAGALLRANGGFLIVKAIEAFSEPGVWAALKRVLLYGKLEINDNAIGFLSPSAMKPEPIELNTKIIMIGNNYIYSVLSEVEEDFNKIFKIKAEFDYEINRDDKLITEYVRVLKKLVTKQNLRDFEQDAVIKILEYAARYAGNQNKLTARFAEIGDLAREADFWARTDKSKTVKAVHIRQAHESIRERHSLMETKILEMIENGTILIDTQGERLGQVNGLAVYDAGRYSFGKPVRITAAVSLGAGNIINVERESGLSGSSHDKGIHIINGYFREIFGRRHPLSFSANIVFEQGYGMIDGDSASAAEICALISCMSDIPIKQSIAITGSVNQKGDIQPIGGINEKIEGFFEICNSRGLTGTQGVIMPRLNVKDLMLNDDVINAVSEKKFHIYPVSSITDAVEIITGVKACEMKHDGLFLSGTVYGRVEKRLIEMKELMRDGISKEKKLSKKKLKK